MDLESFDTGLPEEPEGATVCYTDGSQMSPLEAKGDGIFPEGEVEEHDQDTNTIDNLPPLSSKPMGDVGFGFVIRATPKNIVQWGNLGSDAIVYQGEVFAVHAAALWLLEHPPDTPVHFYIDSQAAIKALNAIEITSKTVLNCRITLCQLERQCPVTLHWVEAHAGHELNEEADRAAKFGTMSRWTYPVPLADCIIKSKLRLESCETWGDRWAAEPTCRQTRLLLPAPDAHMAKFLFKLSRDNISAMVHFISGHNHLLYHQLLTGKTQSALCRLCQEETETAWHFLTKCPALEMGRLMFFLQHQTKENPQPDSLFNFITTFIPHLLVHPGNNTPPP